MVKARPQERAEAAVLTAHCSADGVCFRGGDQQTFGIVGQSLEEGRQGDVFPYLEEWFGRPRARCIGRIFAGLVSLTLTLVAVVRSFSLFPICKQLSAIW